MTNSQLYFAIGVPLLFNAMGFTLIILYVNHRFADFEKLFTEKLLRVEQVLDARLKHVEDKLGIR